MGNFAIQWHARNKPIVDCEIFQKSGGKTLVMIKQGIVEYKHRGRVYVSVPEGNVVKHSFSLIDDGNGYGYEKNRNDASGWRLKLSQLDTAKIPETEAPETIQEKMFPTPE